MIITACLLAVSVGKDSRVKSGKTGTGGGRQRRQTGCCLPGVDGGEVRAPVRSQALSLAADKSQFVFALWMGSMDASPQPNSELSSSCCGWWRSRVSVLTLEGMASQALIS